MSIWVFDGTKSNFDRNKTFEPSHFWQFLCIVGYRVCVIKSSYNFQLIVLQPCLLDGDGLVLLRCKGTSTCLPAILAQGDNFRDFLFASLDKVALQNRDLLLQNRVI